MISVNKCISFIIKENATEPFYRIGAYSIKMKTDIEWAFRKEGLFEVSKYIFLKSA